MAGEDVENAVETVEALVPEDLVAIGRDTKRRRELLARLFAVDPHLVQREVAKQFGVHEETISRDMQIIRAAAGERALDQVAEVGETLEQLAQVTSGALSDVPKVKVDSTTRAAHRNTALKALDQKVNVLFRLGYWAEAPKRHLLGQDPEADPLVVEHVIDPASAAETIEILDRVGARRPDDGDPGSDPEADEVHPSQADAEAGSGAVPEPLP